ncbi:MAG: hypothetical protein OXG33_09905 [Chloroflexi bacterium]|nr:hypothetical protein [Chloroflexota bacterium]
MTDGPSPPIRHVIGIRLRSNGPLLWLDPGDPWPEAGQRVVIAAEDGERTARVAVGRTAAPPGVAISTLRVLGPAEAAANSPDQHVGARVDAVDPPPRHAPPPVSTRRVARFINRLLAVRRRHPDASPTLVDLGQAFPDDDPEDSAGG